jgi:hypothetical protein
MSLIVFAMRRPVTTLMLIAALASGGVLGVSKVSAGIFPPLKTPGAYADSGSIGTRAKQMNTGARELRSPRLGYGANSMAPALRAPVGL